jgi:hypothetical protein
MARFWDQVCGVFASGGFVFASGGLCLEISQTPNVFKKLINL